MATRQLLGRSTGQAYSPGLLRYGSAMVCARSNDCSSGTTSETAFLPASSKLPPRPFSGLLFWFANQQAMGAEHRHLFDNPQPQHADFHTKRWSAERDQRRGRRGSDVDERRAMPGFWDEDWRGVAGGADGLNETLVSVNGSAASDTFEGMTFLVES